METIKKISYICIIIIALAFPLHIFAQTVPSQPGDGTTNPNTIFDVAIENPFRCTNTNCTLMDLIYAILNNIIMPIAAVAVVIWIIWAGFQFVMAQGNSGAIQKAQQNLLWSLIGAGVLLGAAGIAAVVKATIEALIK